MTQPKIAAIGDVHLTESRRGRFRAELERLAEHADLLLLAGDLTEHGTLDEARVVADEYADLPVPVVGILGNHDFHGDVTGEITTMLESRGIRMLQGDGLVLDVRGRSLGVAGVTGFGGGFAGRRAASFGEREMRAFVDRSEHEAAALTTALGALPSGPGDVRVALMHYAPTPSTLVGEPAELMPFLGAQQLGDVVDTERVDLAIHGHAHYGTERGATPGGVPVRNVAQPIIGAAYAVYTVAPDGSVERGPGPG